MFKLKVQPLVTFMFSINEIIVWTKMIASLKINGQKIKVLQT